MTSPQLVLPEWATEPLGMAARISIAVLGIVASTLVLMLATMLSQGAWLFVLVGVTLAATSIRAARYPTLIRLLVVVANLIAIPIIAGMI